MACIRHVFHIDASKEKVFEAISTIEGLKKWWTPDTTGSEEIGGILHFQFGQYGFIKFKVAEINSPEFYRWECSDAHPEWLGTWATFTLSDNEGKTKVSFIHDGWKEASEFFGSCNFSWGRYFASLRDYLETGKGDPFKE